MALTPSGCDVWPSRVLRSDAAAAGAELVADLAEQLDVLLGGLLLGGDEALAHLSPGGDRSRGQLQEPRARAIFEGHGNQFAMTFSSLLAASMLSS